TFENGEVITLQAHARDANGPGITELQFYSNGQKIASVATSSADPLVAGSAQWKPDPGEYTIIAKAVNNSGQTTSSASVHISIIGPRANGVLPQNISITPTFTATGTKKPPTPTFTPTGTKKPITPTFTFTPKPPATMDIWAENTSIIQGNCTIIRWTSTNVTNLSLNGGSVNSNGDMDACPSSSTTYILSGQSTSGSIERSVFIEVIIPAPPPTPPCPSGRSSSDAYISIPGGNCSSHSVGEHFQLCFAPTGSEIAWDYQLVDYTGASIDGLGQVQGNMSILRQGTFSSGAEICVPLIVTEPTGLELFELRLQSSIREPYDEPQVWIIVN
ncbi:MAG: hypothetical protein C0410_04445, partial [Anaerolinea sp.]|nr:hypothetical protein [Anaerolinea sp.]